MTFFARALPFLLLCCLLASACSERVILLPNQEGQVGAVVITPREGAATTLDQAYAKVDVSDTEVGSPTQLSQQEVRDDYAPIFQAEPEPPLKYILYFFNDETRLKPDSLALLDEIVAAAGERGSRDISVVGHTDRAGDADYNLWLSTQRAEAVAKRLTKLGLDRAVMEITSHGEKNPLKPTPDGKHEPLNRRVEVTIR